MVRCSTLTAHKGEVSWAEAMSAVVARVVDVLERHVCMHPILFRAWAAWACTCISFGTRRKTPTPCGASWKGGWRACGLKDGARGVRAEEVEVFPYRIVVSA